MMDQPPLHRRRLTRRIVLRTALAVAGTAALPMLNFGRYQVFAATARKYPARVLKIVERSLVIDMLAPLKLDFTPEAFAATASAQDIEIFRGSGITAFHNAVGIAGPAA